MSKDEIQWWADRMNLASLAAYMADVHQYEDDCAQNIAYMIEKPWKFTDEYNEMREAEKQNAS